MVWQPPPIPDRAHAREGPRPLPPLRRLEVDGNAPEDVVVDAAGRVLTGVDVGRLLRQHDGWRYLGSLAERAVAVLDLPG